MDTELLKKYWDKNAIAWTELSRMGYDTYRDYINTPAFLKMLPEVNGLAGLDIGCGEGHNSQLIATKGARIIGIDISEKFIEYAKSRETNIQDLSFQYGNALEIPFADGSFDFCVSFMAFMDMPNPEKAVREAYRVLKPGGFFQFSISHPIFNTPKWEWIHEEGKRKGIVVGDYFSKVNGEVIDEFIFSAVPEELKIKYEKFKIPRFTMTISQWINCLIDTGFQIERAAEPFPDEETVKEYPNLDDARIVPYFWIVRCRKT